MKWDSNPILKLLKLRRHIYVVRARKHCYWSLVLFEKPMIILFGVLPKSSNFEVFLGVHNLCRCQGTCTIFYWIIIDVLYIKILTIKCLHLLNFILGFYNVYASNLLDYCTVQLRINQTTLFLSFTIPWWFHLMLSVCWGHDLQIFLYKRTVTALLIWNWL